MEKDSTAGQATDDNMVHTHKCWIPNATNTHSEYIILPIAFQFQYWLHKCASMLCYVHTACLVMLGFAFTVTNTKLHIQKQSL